MVNNCLKCKSPLLDYDIGKICSRCKNEFFSENEQDIDIKSLKQFHKVKEEYDIRVGN